MKPLNLDLPPFNTPKDDRWDGLRKLSLTLASTPDLKSLAKMILETVAQVMGVEKALLFLFDEEKGEYRLTESVNACIQPPPLLLMKEDSLIHYLLENEGPLLVSELLNQTPSPEKTDLTKRMSLLESMVSIPLKSKGNLIGLINLGRRSLKGNYTREELDWLSIVASLSSVALESRTLLNELKKSKSHVQRADRLASLGTLTAALAHELRNPLVAIKTFTQLLPERFDDEEFRNHFLHIVSGEVDRISSLVNELLEFARPSDRKIQTEDINTILDSIILLVSTGTKKKHINIVKYFSSNLPSISLDREQIKQVFLNILINAIEATDEDGTITVKTRPYRQEKRGTFYPDRVHGYGLRNSGRKSREYLPPFLYHET